MTLYQINYFETNHFTVEHEEELEYLKSLFLLCSFYNFIAIKLSKFIQDVEKMENNRLLYYYIQFGMFPVN